MGGDGTIPPVNIGDAILHDYLQWLAAAGRSETTMKTRRKHLRMAARELDPLTATPADLDRFFAGHRNWGPNMRRAVHQSLHSFYHFALTRGLRPDDPMATMALPRPKRACPHPCPDATLLRCHCSREDDRLMIDLGWQAGLRRAEIASLRSENLEDGPQLHIWGKGEVERVVPIPEALAARLRARGPGWVFPSPKRPGMPRTPGSVGFRISRALGPGWSAHSLRHRFATRAYYGGGRDVLAVRELLGHASTETTQIYVAVDPESLRRSALAAAS